MRDRWQKIWVDSSSSLLRCANEDSNTKTLSVEMGPPPQKLFQLWGPLPCRGLQQEQCLASGCLSGWCCGREHHSGWTPDRRFVGVMPTKSLTPPRLFAAAASCVVSWNNFIENITALLYHPLGAGARMPQGIAICQGEWMTNCGAITSSPTWWLASPKPGSLRWSSLMRTLIKMS